ncbi:hypothetical protein EDC19_0859 [Natranaerovirga hydrolytica]|uniref:Uncharacterized protein n=1 Tax=Natranaerovirga hydrolytica TaxID=680378 RepID=A0A4R1N5Z8_9FIRM|nr:hypothetical protein EDC19_0859 [Natranaerovirga hydrolytica]
MMCLRELMVGENQYNSKVLNHSGAVSLNNSKCLTVCPVIGKGLIEPR